MYGTGYVFPVVSKEYYHAASTQEAPPAGLLEAPPAPPPSAEGRFFGSRRLLDSSRLIG